MYTKAIKWIAWLLFLPGSCWIAWHLFQGAYDDLPSFYWAAQLVFRDGVSPYALNQFHDLGELLGRKIYPFLYPPPSLLLFSPMLWCSGYDQCKIIFSAINLLLWWILPILVWKLVCYYKKDINNAYVFAAIPLWLLVFSPVADTLRTGQVDLLVLMGVFPLLLAPAGKRQQIACGFLLSLAILLKVYLLLVLPLLFMLRQRTIFTTSMLALLFFMWLGNEILPETLWADWLALSHDSGGYGKQIPAVMTIPWNQSINGFFIRHFLDRHILSGYIPGTVLIYGCSTVVVILTLMAILKLKDHPEGVSTSVALVLLTITLIAPLTWLHHYVFVIPAIVFCATRLFCLAKTLPAFFMKLFFLVCVIVLSAPVLVNLAFPTHAAMRIRDNVIPLDFNFFLSAQMFAVMGIFVVFILLVARPGKSLCTIR